MKRGVEGEISINLDLPIEQIEQVVFIFKAEESENADTLLIKIYSDESEDQIQYIDGQFKIKLTEKESRMLPAGIIYVDSCPVLSDGGVVETKIKKIRINPTLFGIDDKEE